MAEVNNEDETDLNIASRTRSHLRIDNFVPTDNLDFPDVDLNLYHNPDSEVDSEYKKFLNQCYSEELGADTNTDDNDPEYVYNDDIFSHGWRFDLDEVSELNQDESNTANAPLAEQESAEQPTEDREVTHHLPPDVTSMASKSPKPLRRKFDLFEDPEFARILNQQLRQHIQLLTQTFILAKHSTNMRIEAEEAKGYLESYMKIFKHKNKPVNLLPASDLVNNLNTPKELKSSIRLSWRPLPIPEPVNRIIRHNPNIFMYSPLLPKVAFSFLPEKLIPKKPKINFTENEDKLLAYALNEFKGETSQYAFIASLLLAAKNKTQISNHIKNIKRSSGNEYNPIKLYYATGQLPEIDLNSEINLVNPDFVEEELVDIGGGEEPILEKSAEVKSNQIAETIEESARENMNLFDDDNLCKSDLSEVADDIHEVKKESVSQELPPPAESDPAVAEEEVQVSQDDYEDIAPLDLESAPKIDEIEVVQQEDLMDMNLDDLIAASTTISKSAVLNNNEINNNKNIKNLKLKKSMLNLMSHNFLLSEGMGDLIIHDFLKSARQKLTESDNLLLLQHLTRLSGISKNESDQKIVTIYQEISKFLESVGAPPDLLERTVLFLDLDQATKCGCSLSYLHWMRFFEFMQHVEVYHDRLDTLEKKLVRLLDALQKEDSHKVKLAIANLIDKHPFLKREFESLSLDEKPHPSLFICEEDFDDITEPLNQFTAGKDEASLYVHEHFYSRVSEMELSYASQSCPCKCHSTREKFSQHCEKCNLKFVKGRMYLVNKIKPILAEWSYTGRQQSSGKTAAGAPIVWTLEDDREILEFCRMKAEQTEDAISFDTSIFEELVNKRRSESADGGGSLKRSAREIADRFDQLMDMYKEEHPNSSSASQQS